MSNYEKCGAVDTQALQISILEKELAEATEQLAEKDKQIEEIVERAIKYTYGPPDFKYCKTHNCNGSCAYCYRHWLKTGNKEEEKK